MNTYKILILASFIAGSLYGMTPEQEQEAKDKQLIETERLNQRARAQRLMVSSATGLAMRVLVGSVRARQNPNQAAYIARSLEKTKKDFEENMQQFKASYTQEEKEKAYAYLKERKRRRAKLIGKQEID